MAENEIKVGDRVRYTYNNRSGEGVVRECYDDGMYFIHEGCVDLGGMLLDETQLEVIEPAPRADPNSEFLKHLQSLLSDYNAEIIASCDPDGTTYLSIGDKNAKWEVEYENKDITADNIMEFDK